MIAVRVFKGLKNVLGDHPIIRDIINQLNVYRVLYEFWQKYISFFPHLVKRQGQLGTYLTLLHKSHVMFTASPSYSLQGPGSYLGKTLPSA